MDILFIGKRFYTNRDAYIEKFGRIYQLPYYWSKEVKTQLWLIDYHSKEKIKTQDCELDILSTPIFGLSFIFTFLKMIFMRPKIIVASGDCYIGLLGFVLAKLTFSKFVFDVYDKYDAFKGYRNLGFKNLLFFLIKNSNANFFASRILAKEIHHHTAYHILPNGVNYQNFKPIDKNTARKNYKIQSDELIVGYIGSIEKERGVEDLINAIEQLIKDGLNIKLLIAGKGKGKGDINLKHEFIYYLGNLEFKNVPLALSCCDILTIPYRRSEQINYGTSCKIAEYIAMQKPIVATDSANLLEEFPEYIGKLPTDYLAKCHNVTSLTLVLEKQISNPIILDKINNMDWEIIAKKSYLHLKKLFK